MNKVILKYLGLVIFALIIGASDAFAQEGFGTPEPDKSSVIDMVSDKRGLLIPRVALVSTINNTNPIANPANSLLVYNTAAVDDVKPGYYYWSEVEGIWVAMTAEEAEEMDLRLLPNNSHLTIDAGVGGDGTNLGTGADNIAIGNLSLNSITSASSNIAIGSEALKLATETDGIVAIGTNALGSFIKSNTVVSTTGNIPPLAIGHFALENLTTGEYNMTVGNNSGGALTTENNNTILGSAAFNEGNGSQNTFIGSQVASYEGNRESSIFIGYRSGGAIDGTDNISIGNFNYFWGLALDSNNSRSNLLIGNNMGPDNTGQAGSHPYKLEYNVFLGDKILNGPGPFSSSPSIIKHSTIIGRVAGFASNFDMGGGTEVAYATAIGANAKVGANNSIVLGRAETTGTLDNVGIGVTKPTNALHIKSASDPVRFEGLKTGVAEDKSVVVDEDGVLKTVDQVSTDAENITGAKDLTAADVNVDPDDPDNSTIEVIGGEGAVLAETSLRVKNESITTTQIKDGTIEAIDIANANANNVLSTDTEGNPTWKKEAPRFFYMPAVIFNTKDQGTNLERNLYQEYVNQFTGGLVGSGNADYNIAHGANGPTKNYSGGIIGSVGAPADIPYYEADELYYYVTYYDTDVFANLSISDAGVLTYDIIEMAKGSSYMNIVFVIK